MKKSKSTKLGGFRQRMDEAAAVSYTAIAKKASTTAIVNTINAMISILRDKGIKIRDWDDKDKIVQTIRYIGGRVYVLALDEQVSPEETSHDENGASQSGK